MSHQYIFYLVPPIINSNAFLISIVEINANFLSMISMRIKCIDFLDNSPPFPSPHLPSPPHKHILEYIQRNFLPIYSTKSLPNHNHILIDVYFALLMYYI